MNAATTTVTQPTPLLRCLRCDGVGRIPLPPPHAVDHDGYCQDSTCEACSRCVSCDGTGVTEDLDLDLDADAIAALGRQAVVASVRGDLARADALLEAIEEVPRTVWLELSAEDYARGLAWWHAASLAATTAYLARARTPADEPDVPCRACGGTGYDEQLDVDSYRQCTACGGSGRMPW